MGYLLTYSVFIFLFFCNDPATPEIYTLSLHDALPILTDGEGRPEQGMRHPRLGRVPENQRAEAGDRKSTRLNSSHRCISYAVFCLKKKNKKRRTRRATRENGQNPELSRYASSRYSGDL